MTIRLKVDIEEPPKSLINYIERHVINKINQIRCNGFDR